MQDRLRFYGEVRALVHGQYAEASQDVHDFLSTAADAIAQRRWATLGARTPDEARGFVMARLRRTMGVRVGFAMARHRISRVPYIGIRRGAVIRPRAPHAPLVGIGVGAADFLGFIEFERRRGPLELRA